MQALSSNLADTGAARARGPRPEQPREVGAAPAAALTPGFSASLSPSSAPYPIALPLRPQAYASNYSGHAKVDRLLYVAERSRGGTLEADALRLVVEELKQVGAGGWVGWGGAGGWVVVVVEWGGGGWVGGGASGR